MREDRQLIREFKRGDPLAPCRIYEKYKQYLLTIGLALMQDASLAEDVVHDVFVTFVQRIDRFELNGSLKQYLAKCVVNRVRTIRGGRSPGSHLEDAGAMGSGALGPDAEIQRREEHQRLLDVLSQLPYEQREVIVLYLKAGMTFRRIAGLQKVSINTVQSRYRYGLRRLRSLLNDEATPQA